MHSDLVGAPRRWAWQEKTPDTTRACGSTHVQASIQELKNISGWSFTEQATRRTRLAIARAGKLLARPAEAA